MPPKKTQHEQPIDQGQLLDIEVSRLKPAKINAVVEGGFFPGETTPTTEPVEQPHIREVVAPVADLRERAQFLGRAVNHMAIVSRGSGYKKAVHTSERSRIAKTTKHNVDELDVGVAFTSKQELKRAKQEFLHAYNLGTEKPVTLDDPDLGIAFAEFGYKYGVGGSPEQTARKSAARTKFRQALKRHKKIEGELVPQTYEISVESAAETPQVNTEAIVPELADTRRKLIGLRDDSRAGFMPTNHREKSQAYELLSYMEPGRYEKGISTRLDEIFYRQQRETQKKPGMTPQDGYEVAKDSVRSVVREWGDHLADARASWEKLRDLGRLISETPNPRLSLEEMLDEEGQGQTLTQLIRHDVLRKYRDGEAVLGFDPLWVREDRTNPTDEKHKTVEDMFTHQSEGFMAAYVRRRAQQMSVGEVREIVKEAMADQVNRGMFWRGVLESLNDDYKQYAELALQQKA